ncbi:hypothetical protein [Microbulbifer sediminum]|uniref:hypothetical protein n=1 Tax=Microbulbifer sediminum TaxID=2904250 RepID=UPI001F4802EC|nr:hypothetical protein [Microbulbifer sediminum]
MKKIVVLLAALVIQGCAARLAMTEQQEAILSGLTPAEADKSIVRLFTRTDEQSGLFSSNGSPFMSNPQVLEIKDGKVVYSDFEEHVAGINTRSLAGTVDVDIDYDHTVEKFSLDFRKIKKISIVSPGVLDQSMLNSDEGVQLGLHANDGVFVNIDIKKEYMDQAIAVVKFYNADAEIKSGIGL